VADVAKHRYGKNLRQYYHYWSSLGFPNLQCGNNNTNSNTFFDWLDSKGACQGQPLPELPNDDCSCPRSKLDSDTVLYIKKDTEAQKYALTIQRDASNDNKARVLDIYGKVVQTGPAGWIFVLRSDILYGAPKITTTTDDIQQRFHHSSFFGGQAVTAAGIFITTTTSDGDSSFLTHVYPHSGHYRPGEVEMQRMIWYIMEKEIDLDTIQVDTQQLLHMDRTTTVDNNNQNSFNSTTVDNTNLRKWKKVESLYLETALSEADYLANKARLIRSFNSLAQIK
jgi:hypothetical protein